MALIHSVTTSDSNTYGLRATAIPFGVTDSTSTSTVVTATVTGVTELVDGEIMFLTNGAVTTAAGWTLNVNGLGAKPVYSTMAEESRITTTFSSAYTMLFIYNSSRVDGGCWDMYYGYDSNTNTIGYQLRNNSCNMTAAQTGYRYRLWLTDADGQGWVPINTSTATNATTVRSLNTRPIDPFGRIVYCNHNATKSAGAGLGTAYQWDQYTLAIGYSYVMTLTAQAPVYLRCTPQADGSAVMQDIVQTLPTTNDGYIYIFLGTSYSTTSMELLPVHPVYYHDGTGIRLWTGATPQGGTQNTWYGTCTTDANEQTKVVTTSSGDFSLETGSMVRVKFKNGQNYDGGIKLDVDGTGAINVMRQGTTITVQYFFQAGEVVDFVYDGTNYTAVNKSIASRAYYGVTKLSSATDSTSAAMAATPSAVKEAYDLASSKQDALVSGENIKTINGESILGSGDITVGGGGATEMTDAEVNTAVDDAFVYNITLNAGASIASVQNLQGQTVTTGIAGGTYKVVVDTDSDGWYASSTPQVTFQLDSVSKTASFVMPDEAINIDVFVPHGGGSND